MTQPLTIEIVAWKTGLGRANIREVIDAFEACGWQLVPKEPTEEMRIAGTWMDDDRDKIARTAYRAMLMAAPKVE